MLTNIIEGLIFAAATGVTYDAIKSFFGQDYTEKEIKQAINNIKESGKFNQTGSTIYEIKRSSLYTGESEEAFFGDEDEEETPDFLEGEDFVSVESEVSATEDEIESDKEDGK